MTEKTEAQKERDYRLSPYYVPRPTLWLYDYGPNGELVMWDAMRHDTPKIVLDARKQNAFWIPVCYGLAFICIMTILFTAHSH